MAQVCPSTGPCVRGRVPRSQRTGLLSPSHLKHANLAPFHRHASAWEDRSSTWIERGNFAGENFRLPRGSTGDDILRSWSTKTRGRATLSSFDDQRTGFVRLRGRPQGSLSSLRACSVLSPSCYPAGTGAAAHTAGPVKSQAAASASASAAESATESTSEPASESSLKAEGQLSPSSDASDSDVVESAKEPRRQRRARGGPVGRRPSSKAETVNAASSSDTTPGLDAAIPRAAASAAANGGEQDASTNALGSTGNDASPKKAKERNPTKKASGGRKTKLPLVKDQSTSSSKAEDDSEPRKTKLPSPLTSSRRREALPCPSWDVLMQQIKAKHLTSSPGQEGLGGDGDGQQVSDGPPEGSTDEVLQALTLLGLSYEWVAEHIKPNSGLLRHQKMEGLIASLELYREYGLSTANVRSLLRANPKAFSCDVAAVRQILDFLLDLGVNRCRLGSVVVGSQATTLNMEANLLPKTTFLRSLGAGSVATLVEKAPSLLRVKLLRLQDNARVLRAALGAEELLRVLARNPRVLTFPTEDMSAFFRIIRGRYHLEPGVLATMLSRVSLFRETTQESMEATLEILESLVGVERAVDLIARKPRVLFRDPEAIQTTIQNLTTLMTPATVEDLLLADPIILGYDWINSIEPGLRYAVEHCGISYKEAVRTRVFRPSLDNVVKPRVEFVLSQGMVVVSTERGLTRNGPRRSTKYLSMRSVITSLKRFQQHFPGYTGR